MEYIMTTFFDLYHELFSSKESEKYIMVDIILKIITEEDNRWLNREVSLEEVKEAVFSLGASKAPGPDGLNGMFYQKSWEIVKWDILGVVNEFFQSGQFPEPINETLIVVIPKIENLETVSQFRPISCTNFIYKIFAKTLVNWIKRVLSRLIS